MFSVSSTVANLEKDTSDVELAVINQMEIPMVTTEEEVQSAPGTVMDWAATATMNQITKAIAEKTIPASPVYQDTTITGETITISRKLIENLTTTIF